MNWCLVLIIALVRSTTGLEQEAASTAESISENNQENFENHLYVSSTSMQSFYRPQREIWCLMSKRGMSAFQSF